MTLIEDILGDYGFRLIWSGDQRQAQVTVYRIIDRRGTDPVFEEDSPKCALIRTSDHTKAVVYLSASIRDDGYTETDAAEHSWMGAEDYALHILLLQHLFAKAGAMMGFALSDPWQLEIKEIKQP